VELREKLGCSRSLATRALRNRLSPIRVGQRVLCQVRGEMIVRGMTGAPIPWPLGSPKGHGGQHSLIVYKDLAKAIRRESNQAVAHWWGIDPQMVTKWRKLLNVKRGTQGTTRLFRPHIAEFGNAMRGR